MERTIKFNGVAAVILAVSLLAVAGLRLSSLAGNNDPQLEKVVRQELWMESAGDVVDNIERMWRKDDYSGAAIAKASPEGIAILKLATSRPLLHGSSKERVIVHVRYRVPGDAETQERYMEFTHGGIGNSWRYRYESSALSYYLNLF